MPEKTFNILIDLSSCVAVFTGPEEATRLVSTKSGGMDWLSTSQITVIKSQHSGYTVNLLLTHSNFVSNSLSNFYENLSALFIVVFLL